MRTVVRAREVPISERAEYIRGLVGEAVGPLEVRVGDGFDVPDQLVIGGFGGVGIAELSAAHPGGADRTRRHVQLLDADICKVDVVAAGWAVVEQDGRQAVLGTRDFAFVDLSRPAHWTNGPATRIIALTFPRALLPLASDAVAGLTGVRIPGDEGAGALMSSMAPQLVRHLDDYGAADGARLATAVLDLLTIALAVPLDSGDALPEETQRSALLLRIHAFIEEWLSDPDLSPRTIAAAHYISLRHLYKLFETQQTSVAGWIRERRLERCRRDLLDPAHRYQPVSAIAARWGLTNAALFSRAFRAAYGVSPVEYRRIGHG